MTDSETMVANIKRKRIIESIGKGKRLDGRGLLDYREIETNVGFVDKAAGSAMVSIGNTKVLAGVSVETGEPYSDKPDDGVLVVNAELSPIASPSFEPGPPDEDAVELARVVDRGLRESKAMNLKELCITPKEKVFVVFVDLWILNHDGTLFDACAMASILALMDAEIPEYDLTDEGGIEFKESTVNLPLQEFPLEVTVSKIGGKLVVDTSLEEEAIAESRMTVALGEKNEVYAIQKSLLEPLTLDEVYESMDIVKDKIQELRDKYLRGVGGWLERSE